MKRIRFTEEQIIAVLREHARSLGPQGTVSKYLNRARRAGLTWPLPQETLSSTNTVVSRVRRRANAQHLLSVITIPGIRDRHRLERLITIPGMRREGHVGEYVGLCLGLVQAARPLHDPGNHRASERWCCRQSSNHPWLTGPAMPAIAVTRRQLHHAKGHDHRLSQ